ncbi:MAG: peptide chain release factor 1, partial [Acidobacteria bacterium]|nr:peptide chain release factor 1 [Acidobacteriota bacterium]
MADGLLFDKLRTVESRYESLMGRVSDAAVQADPAEFRASTKAHAELQPQVGKVGEHHAVER